MVRLGLGKGLAALAAAALTTGTWAASPKPTDVIYLGTIITMDSAAPAAEAVAVRGEQIVAVGARDAVLRLRGKKTQVVELDKRALVPGFIDSHGHASFVNVLSFNVDLSPPPAGTVNSIAELQEALRETIRRDAIAPGSWVVGFGYDDSLLKEGRAPTRDDLDAVSTEHPVYVAHVSGHLGAGNSRVLALARIDANTPDPPGGHIRRLAGSNEPNGVLEESAHSSVYTRAPRPMAEQLLQALPRTLEYYASMGVTTVQDGGTMPENIALFEEAARRKLLSLDVVAYRMWMPVGAAFPANPSYGQYHDRFKLGGIKMVLDGSPQGKTAFLTKPYIIPPAGQPKDYRGYPSMPKPVVERAVREVIANKVTLLAHANGDAAADILIDAVDGARRDAGNNDTKVVMIHAQTVRADQLDRMAALGITPSFFVGHTFYWGDWHRDQTVGEPWAENISPTRWALDRAIPFTVHNDSPVVPPNMLRTLWSATTRRTRSNDILGPMQRLTIAEALAALTINGARQYWEENIKGSISVGKLADFVILNRNPLAVNPERIQQDLRVEETISHGKTVYRRL